MMNHLITYNEVADFLKNPSLLAPRPKFVKIGALHKHNTQDLKQLACPQSAVHGWAGLDMDPTRYTLLDPTAFFSPANPGKVPAYPNFAANSVMKVINCQFKATKNYWMLYMNITCAIFCMLNENINDSFKVSNNPNLMGWNPMMSIQLILKQLKVLHGQPKGNTLWDNNNLFKLAFTATNAPEMLFHRIKHCQEIAIIGQMPYTQAQLIANAVPLLLALGMFPMKEFEDWEAVAMIAWHLCMARRVNVSFQSSSVICPGSEVMPWPRICMQCWPMGSRIGTTTQRSRQSNRLWLLL
jgi:hypothetical protein